MYAYATDGSEGKIHGRDFFMDYIFDLKTPTEKMKTQPFDAQAQSLLGDLDSFRAGFGSE